MALTHIYDPADHAARQANAQALRGQVTAAEAQLDAIIDDVSAPTAAKVAAAQKQLAATLRLILRVVAQGG